MSTAVDDIGQRHSSEDVGDKVGKRRQRTEADSAYVKGRPQVGNHERNDLLVHALHYLKRNERQ